jgi:hypothetical protein
MSVINRSITGVFHNIVGNLQEIIRSEILLAKTEVKEQASKAIRPAIRLGIGTALACMRIRTADDHVSPLDPAAHLDRGPDRHVSGRDHCAGDGPLSRCRLRKDPAGAPTNAREREGEHGMGERADALELHIRQERQELEENIQELEGVVKGAVDWRVQTRQRPLAMMLLAFAGGVVLAAILRR